MELVVVEVLKERGSFQHKLSPAELKFLFYGFALLYESFGPFILGLGLKPICSPRYSLYFFGVLFGFMNFGVGLDSFFYDVHDISYNIFYN